MSTQSASTMRKYDVFDGTDHYEIEASSIEEALKKAIDDVNTSCNFSNHDDDGRPVSTQWFEVTVNEMLYDDDGEFAGDSEFETVAVDPPEPECKYYSEIYNKHNWRQPGSVVGYGIEGHGGGVITTEVCSQCGVYMITDTWAQNRENGQQGLESLEFRDADERSMAWVERLRAEEDDEDEEEDSESA